MLLAKYLFGDTAVYFVRSAVEGHENAYTVSLSLYPASVEIENFDALYGDSLVQVAFTGDKNLIDYTQGLTMRNHSSTLLTLKGQAVSEGGVTTLLTDEKGNEYTHHLDYDEKTGVFTTWVEYLNGGEEERTLELLDSFSLSGIAAPSRKLKSTCGLSLHRMTAAWSRECRLKSDSFSHLGLDMSWGRYGVKVEKFGQRGSMPVRDYFPFAAIEDQETGFLIAAMMEAPYSWQMEVYEEKETCSLSGGLGDYEFAHWRKKIPPKGSFCTHKAFLKVGFCTVNDASNAFVHHMDDLLKVPEFEENMPILFNEYCTTWGNPSPENIKMLLEALRPLPVETFVIDSGWYKPVDKGWCNAIGDWNQNRELFPNGIQEISSLIHQEGKKAGIWFEFEVVGSDSEIFHDEEMLLHRDGTPLTTKNRRFLDLRKEEVTEYLDEKMIKFLAENGFDYLKIDYNDNIGMGCDSSDGAALGEGGRQVQEESLRLISRLQEGVKDIIIENCSSGGSRIEPCRMSRVSMCSFSDAHECKEIPLVAANVSRVVPARQSQIWAVIRESDDKDRIVWSLTAAMFGRICLSGDVHKIGKDKMELIQEGLEFYSAVKDLVRYGDIKEVDNTVEYFREPFGRQVYEKEFKDKKLLLVHAFERAEEVKKEMKGYRLERVYATIPYTFENGVFAAKQSKNYQAGAFLFVKE